MAPDHPRERGKMEDRIHPIQGRLHRAEVADVSADPRTIRHPDVRVESQIEERHCVARLFEPFGQVAADESTPAGNQNPAHCPSPKISTQAGRREAPGLMESTSANARYISTLPVCMRIDAGCAAFLKTPRSFGAGRCPTPARPLAPTRDPGFRGCRRIRKTVLSVRGIPNLAPRSRTCRKSPAGHRVSRISERRSPPRAGLSDLHASPARPHGSGRASRDERVRRHELRLRIRRAGPLTAPP